MTLSEQQQTDLRLNRRDRLLTLAHTTLELRSGKQLLLRPANYSDAQAIHTVTSLAFEEFKGQLNPANGSEFETILSVTEQLETGGALIAAIDAHCVGSLRLVFNEDHLYVGRVGTEPVFRGLGIASALMKYAETAAMLLGYMEIRLGTREQLDSNVRLYLGLGYQIDRIMKHPRGDDNVVLFKKQFSTIGETM